MPATAVSPAPMVQMQGIAVPSAAVNPAEFFRLTRRLTFTQKSGTYAGLGNTDNLSILQTGIISGLSLKFSGSLVIALPTGTAATTARWPLDIPRAIRLSANGQSNLVNCSGSKLKLRDVMALGNQTDRGISQGVGGASPGTATNQGTLSLASEAWGVGSAVTAIPAGTYPVELNWYIPVAFDERSLTGAIFAQTSATDLNVAIDWAPLTDLFVLTGTATATLTGTITLLGRAFSIPEQNGQILVPDLSVFHSIIQSRYVAVANGDNEVRLSGQGVGRQLLRAWYQVWNGTAPGAPLAMTAANFGQQGWRFGGNDTPEAYPDARHLRMSNERLFGDDVGSVFGFGVWDFCSDFSFRDSVDEGTATELRLLINIASGVTLTTPAVEYVQETVFAGPTGA